MAARLHNGRTGGPCARRCAVASFLRLFSFVPAGPGAVPDQLLRDAIMPDLLDRAEVRHAYAARSGSDDQGPRLAASIWELDAPAEQPPAVLVDLLDGERAAGAESTLEVLPLAVALPFVQPEEPRILRLFRGQTLPGDLDSYVEAARDGTYEDVMAEHGPAALFLAIRRPDEFVTLSVWTAWDNIAAATGGNLRQPIATRHAHRLARGTAEHYEIVPNSIAPRPQTG